MVRKMEGSVVTLLNAREKKNYFDTQLRIYAHRLSKGEDRVIETPTLLPILVHLLILPRRNAFETSGAKKKYTLITHHVYG